MLHFWSVPKRKALLFVLMPGGVAAAIGLAAAGVLGGPVAAVLTAFFTMVALLLDVGSGLARVMTRPPPNRGNALAWGILLFVMSLLLTFLLLEAFCSPQIF